ncbi:hypothetical protein Ahy_A06g026870 [Arachis hypogaea]|uniref:Aminotransferase-like plant mobile domain-containing protein n=1 Tax=Arachis hypogaea TaxID=3818 RepID=A0A445CLW8_ARAHY|nr:hypothetical protein Ahy_A06g026870 [Arachis hypogaea]
MDQQLLGYEDTIYRLDQAEHIAGRVDRVDTTEESLLRYTGGYIMRLIGGILFPDASDSRVYIRWLPMLEDLDACGRLSWGLAVLSWMWVQYRPDNARGEGRFKHYRRILNEIGMLYTSHKYLSFPHLLGGWHELWDQPADHRLHIHHHIDLCSSLSYMTWYLQWAHTELFGQGDQHLVPSGVMLEDLPIYHPPAAELHQPEDGHLLELLREARGDEIHRDRDPISPPSHGPEAGAQTVGTLSGPLPGGYVSFRPLGHISALEFNNQINLISTTFLTD